MAWISEIHYQNTYASGSGGTEFVEVSLSPSEFARAGDFVFATYQSTGEAQILVSAIKLTELPRIFVDTSIQKLCYFHLLFDRHEIIFSEGAKTESLFTGPEALKAISTAAREEILTLFPDMRKPPFGAPARHIPNGKLQKQIMARHASHAKPVQVSNAFGPKFE